MSQVALDEVSLQPIKKLASTIGCSLELSLGMAVTSYPKVLIRGQLFISNAGSRSTKRNSSTVSFCDPTQPHSVCFGVIQRFISIQDTLHVALVFPVTVTPFELFSQDLPHEIAAFKDIITSDYVATNGREELIAVQISDITIMYFNVSTAATSLLTPLLKEMDTK